MGGGQLPDLQNIIQDGIPDNSLVWIRYLGDDPQDQANPFQIPPQGSLLICRNSSGARHVKAVGVTIFGGSYGNIGPRGNGDIIPPPIEYNHPVYCNSYDTEDISVEVTAERTISETMVV